MEFLAKKGKGESVEIIAEGFINKGGKNLPAVFFKGEQPEGITTAIITAMLRDDFLKEYSISSAFIGLMEYQAFPELLKDMYYEMKSGERPVLSSKVLFIINAREVDEEIEQPKSIESEKEKVSTVNDEPLTNGDSEQKKDADKSNQVKGIEAMNKPTKDA